MKRLFELFTSDSWLSSDFEVRAREFSDTADKIEKSGYVIVNVQEIESQGGLKFFQFYTKRRESIEVQEAE